MIFQFYRPNIFVCVHNEHCAFVKTLRFLYLFFDHALDIVTFTWSLTMLKKTG
jgi:hypothetical protein